MVDLTGQSIIKHEYVHDGVTGHTTITFRDNLDVSLGTFKIETLKYKKFMEMLGSIAKSQFDDFTPDQEGTRTSFDKRTSSARSEF